MFSSLTVFLFIDNAVLILYNYSCSVFFPQTISKPMKPPSLERDNRFLVSVGSSNHAGLYLSGVLPPWDSSNLITNQYFSLVG